MQACSLPFNSKKVEFSEYQLEIVAELSAESMSFPRSSFRLPTRVTSAAIILSILFHSILATITFFYLDKPNQKEIPHHNQSKSIKVKIVNSTKPKNDIKKKEDKTQPIENKITKDKVAKPDSIVKSESVLTEPTKSVKNRPKIIEQNNKISSTFKAQINAQENTERILDPLIYDKNIEIYEPTPEAFNEGTIVFNPNFRKRIKEIQREKFERSKITGFMQRQKDNEYFEFKPVGGSQTVRINGNCFVVPEKDVFALSQNVWALLGNCENKMDKLNFEKPELKYRYNKKTISLYLLSCNTNV